MPDPLLDASPASAPLQRPARALAHADTQAAAGAPAPSLVARPDLLVCDECGSVHRRVVLARGHVARCCRCNALLGRGHVMRVQGLLAFALGALLLLLIGNLAPIVTLDLRGVVNEVSLPEALAQTWHSGEPVVALLAGLTAVAFPLALTVLRLYVLVPLVLGRLPHGFVPAMRTLRFVTHWSMVEVFMMGTLVAVVRSAGLAGATPGMGLWAYAALTLLLTSITAAGLHSLWKLGTQLGAG